MEEGAYIYEVLIEEMWGIWAVEICHMFVASIFYFRIVVLQFIFADRGWGPHGQRSFLELKINPARFNLLMGICL